MSPARWFRRLGLSALLITLGFAAPALTQTPKGKKYALLVGVKEYKRATFPDLKYPENDVEELAKVLTKAGFDKVRVLTHVRGKRDAADAPTAANIDKALAELVDDRARHDTVLLALSGHGAAVEVPDPNDKEKPKVHPFFCPYDADLTDISYSTGRSKFLININDVFTQLGRSGASNKLVLMDACRNELKAEGSTRSLDEGAVRVPKGVGVLFSCSPEERAWESEKLKHGVFFHYVLEGLRDKAKNEDGEVTWLRLSAHVTRQVEKQVPVLIKGGASQKPHSVGNVPGDPVLVRVSKEDEGPLDKAGKNSIGMKFELIPKGTFLMGAGKDDKDAADDEKPQHKVEISKAFYLGAYEVTQKEWKALRKTNPSHFGKDGKGKDKLKDTDDPDTFPVDSVSYEDAIKFIEALNEKEKPRLNGWRYSLPTEAQWEYACRGKANSSKKYHVGNTLSKVHANFNNDVGRTCMVGSYDPNDFGLYDMHGNVWEWCADWYEEEYDKTALLRDPLGPSKGTHRVLRGGGWGVRGPFCRASSRFYLSPSYQDVFLGLRVALVPTR